MQQRRSVHPSQCLRALCLDRLMGLGIARSALSPRITFILHYSAAHYQLATPMSGVNAGSCVRSCGWVKNTYDPHAQVLVLL